MPFSMEEIVFIHYSWNNIEEDKFEVTALDVCKSYIVLGSKYGSLYFYDMKNMYLKKKMSTGNGVITEVSISPDEAYLAYSFSSGIAQIIKIPHIEPSKKLHPSYSREHEGSIITAIVWSHEGRDIYIGDNEGVVSSLHITSNLATSLLLNLSLRLVVLHSPVVQMDIHEEMLLVSTLNSSYICHTKLETFSSIGTKSRNGEYGSCFCLYQDNYKKEDTKEKKQPEHSTNNSIKENLLTKRGLDNLLYVDSPKLGDLSSLDVPYQASKLGIFCSRPKFRLWECNLRGEVVCTLQLESAMNVPQSVIFSYSSLNDDKIGTRSWNVYVESNIEKTRPTFKQLFQLCPSRLIAISLDAIYIINAQNAGILSWVATNQTILKAKVYRNIITLLLKDGTVEKYVASSYNTTMNQFSQDNFKLNCSALSYRGDVLKNILDTRKMSLNSLHLDTLTNLITLNSDTLLYVADSYQMSRVGTEKSNESSSAESYVEDNSVYEHEALLEKRDVSSVAQKCDADSSSHVEMNNQNGFFEIIDTELPEDISDFFRFTEKLVHMHCQKKVISNQEATDWLTDYRQVVIPNEQIFHDLNSSYKKQISDQIVASFMVCMKLNIVLEASDVDIEAYIKDIHYLTPVIVAEVDCFYASMIASDAGLLNASYILNNLHEVSINLYPKTWSALYVQLAAQQPSKIPTDHRDKPDRFNVFEKLDLLRSQRVPYMSEFADVKHLEELTQIAVALSNEHVIYDFVYFLMLMAPEFDDPQRFVEQNLYNFLSRIDNLHFLYAQYWSACPELQYMIVSCALKNNGQYMDCLCNTVVCGSNPNIHSLLDAVFSLPLHYLNEILLLCIESKYFRGIQAIIFTYEPDMVPHILPWILVFGCKSDIVKAFEAVSDEHCGLMLQLLAKMKQIRLSTCLICDSDRRRCDTSCHDAIDLREEEHVLCYNDLLELITNNILNKLGALRTLKLLNDWHHLDLCLSKRFYQNCIKLSLEEQSSNRNTIKNYSNIPPVSNKILIDANMKVFNTLKTQNTHGIRESVLSQTLHQFFRTLPDLKMDYKLVRLKEQMHFDVKSSPNRGLSECSNGDDYKEVDHGNLSSSSHQWGAEASIKANYCRLCSLDLTTPAMLNAGGLTVYSCGHVFHQACIQNKTCPLCI